jgi:hypothetical protein
VRRLPGDRRNARSVAYVEDHAADAGSVEPFAVAGHVNRAGRQHLKPHAARPRVCLCQAPDYRTPVRPALVLLEPNRGKLLALDRWLVNANQLIRD